MQSNPADKNSKEKKNQESKGKDLFVGVS